MNLIPKICKLLGVEIGEEFGTQEVENCDTEMFRYKYRFMQTELQFKVGDYWIPTTIPTSLLTGQAEIKKLPFKPKEHERYWYVYVGDDEIGNTRFTEANTNDLMRVYCGNCFRSEAEAQAHKYEIYEKLTGRKWEEKCDS